MLDDLEVATRLVWLRDELFDLFRLRTVTQTEINWMSWLNKTIDRLQEHRLEANDKKEMMRFANLVYHSYADVIAKPHSQRKR